MISESVGTFHKVNGPLNIKAHHLILLKIIVIFNTHTFRGRLKTENTR